jgi:hypothetical protein
MHGMPGSCSAAFRPGREPDVVAGSHPGAAGPYNISAPDPRRA